ncbi:polymorphic toxin type 5 domain-containing protein [Streptomyces sp. R35]|uniref:Polymorphic toxin type 5 domain-containing protein n=1 Tax=Streptomyces sp. R35 TaxID=3238630 RepID=A0AB39SRD2_9ACTN
MFLSIRQGIREFERFLRTGQAAELGLEAARFAAPEMAQDLATLKNSYLRAIAGMGTVRAHARTLGLGERETSAFLRMWGERPTPMTAEQVAQEMDVWNTMRQQGLPSALSSAEEAAPVTLKASVLPHHSSKPAFMEAMRRRLLAQRASGKPSLLGFLLDADGQWQKGSFVARSGRPMHGRYALSDPDQQIVQAGHLQSHWYARAMSRRDYLMLEDADLNGVTGSAEAAGPVTSKPAVLIEDYPVDIPTARLWEAHGCLTPGTVSAAPVVERPAL